MTQPSTVASDQPETLIPSSRLVIAAGNVVTIQRMGEEARVRAEVLGAVPDAYIALRYVYGSPKSRTLGFLNLRAEDSLILRFMHEGVVYGFRTAVSRLVTDPDYLVFVRYPRFIEQVSVRRERRMSCRMPCLVTLDSGVARPGLMLDVSSAGCRVIAQLNQAEAVPPEGFPVTVTLALPDQAEPLHAVGEVRRLTGDEEGRGALGIAFNHEQRKLCSALERYLWLAPNR